MAAQPAEKEPEDILKLEEVKLPRSSIFISKKPAYVYSNEDAKEGPFTARLCMQFSYCMLLASLALSDRSTCRATAEKIKKGEWRVGIEAWRAGRNSMTWQCEVGNQMASCLSLLDLPKSRENTVVERKNTVSLRRLALQKADAFLKNCFVEECTKGNSGTCKLTGHKFAKGEVRFVYSTGDKKIFLTIPSAAAVIQPVIDVCHESFTTSDIKGLDEIPESDKTLLLSEFKAKQGEGGTKRQASGEAAKDADVTPPKAKRRRGKQAVKKEEEEAAEPVKKEEADAQDDKEDVKQEEGGDEEGSDDDEEEV